MAEDFGAALRRLRVDRDWRQRDLSDHLGTVARSTIANLESGRESPTPRIWSVICEQLPEWVPVLDGPYNEARRRQPIRRGRRPRSARRDAALLGGPFVVELAQFTYVFRHSRSPEEIIEHRRVRATSTGADGYGLKMSQTDGAGFHVDEEPLWGGSITEAEHIDAAGTTVYARRVDFGRQLRRGQVHDFAVRSWVENDPFPGTSVGIAFNIPCERLAIHLNFLGPTAPAALWRYGPVVDPALAPLRPETSDSYLDLSTGGGVSEYVDRPETGCEYGIAWQWDE